MLREWLHSLKSFPQAAKIDINILDAGLTDKQKRELAPLVNSIVTPDWPCELPDYKTKGKDYLKACVCRPFLPQIFPGYESYIWMDADTWIQSWDGVALFIEGAKRKKITVTAQVDRAYPRGGARIKWLGQIPWKVRGFYYSNALKAYGFSTARDLLPYHVLLAGTFALHRDAPHWTRWQELVIQTMKKGRVFTAEQLSLGLMCYLEGYEFEILPAWAHWLCEFKPLWNKEKNKFVEPFLPHAEISILHLSGFDSMRVIRSITTDFKTTDGGKIEKSYRYPHFDGEQL
jgi:hypothetical protein